MGFRVLAILCCGVLGCSRGAEEVDHVPTPTASVEAVPGEDVAAAAKAGNDFAFDLYGHLRATAGNLAFSPYSIATALSMAASGARGTTLDQMLQTLRTDLPPDRLHPAQAALIHRLFHAGGGPRPYRIHVANALWGQDGLSFDPAFTSGLTSYYGAQMHHVDFRDAATAAKTINRWVEDQTARRIKDLVSPGMFNRDTVFVLTNAIYFNGKWEEPFKEKLTTDRPFHLSPGESADVPTMKQVTYTNYHKGEGFAGIVLPYEGRELSMVLLLPDATGGLAQLEAKLAEDATWSWVDATMLQSVDIQLPRFLVTGAFDLKETLNAMGMTLPFDPTSADFSGTGVSPIFIAFVVHRAYVDVNERGTEAAAATGIVAEKLSTSDGPIPFHADHPFIFAIRHNPTGSLLFLGRVTDPRK